MKEYERYVLRGCLAQMAMQRRGRRLLVKGALKGNGSGDGNNERVNRWEGVEGKKVSERRREREK
jgi:hypothetical protein